MRGLSLKPPLRILIVLIFHLHLLTESCRGQIQLIGPSRPIVALTGDDATLPCHLKPAKDVTAETLEWTRSDLSTGFVHVWRAGQDLVNARNPSYRGRTSLFIDELKNGNISVKLSKVKLSDEGTYEGYAPALDKRCLVKLVVASAVVASPVITLMGTDRDRSGVELQCESEGWYPEPEVLWLDAEGNLLSAGPTETVRGPDDLYTVSSRVTVEKRHSNSFTCRVQQKDITQTRETRIHVPDDFFIVPSSSSLPVIIGLAVSLAVCVVIILAFVLRKAIVKTKRKNCDETDGEKNGSKSNKTKVQFVTETKREKEKLMTEETVQMEDLNEDKVEKTKDLKKQRSERQRKEEEAEERVKTLKKELETKKNEVQNKQAELQQLHEEKQRMERELQMLKKELENKNKQLERVREAPAQDSPVPGKAEQQQKDEVETVKKQLETKETELQTKTKEFAEKQAELQQLQDENQRMETDLQTVEKELENIRSQLERSRDTPAQSFPPWKIISRQKLREEQQRREEAENKVQTLMEELKTRTEELKELQAEKQRTSGGSTDQT